MSGEIFISYRRADEPHARLLYNRLKEHGVEAWYDAHVGAGEDWRTATAKALQNARIFVLLFSRAAAASDDITKELAAATFSKKLVVPVRLEDIQPEGAFLYELAGRNWINAFEETEAKLGELARSLAALVRSGKEDPAILPFDRNASGATAAPKKRGRIGLVAAGAGLALVVLTGVGAYLLKPAPAKPQPAGGSFLTAVFGFEAAGGDKRLADVAASMTDLTFQGLSAERLATAARTETAGVAAADRFARAQSLGAVYAVSGEARADGERDVISLRLEDVASRTVILEEAVPAEGSLKPFVAARASTLVATTLRCMQNYDVGPRPDRAEVVKLIATVCREIVANKQPSIQPWRQLVGLTPDSAALQGAFVSSIQPYLGFYPAAMQATLLQEAEAALAHAEAADPKAGSTHLAQYALARWKGEPLARQEELLLAALAAQTDSAWINFWYADFLASVGRSNEAWSYAQAAVNDDPLVPIIEARMAQATAAAGGGKAAAEAYRRVVRRSDSIGSWSSWVVSSLFAGAGDPEEVLQLAPPGISPAGRDCLHGVFAAAHSREKKALQRAAASFLDCGAKTRLLGPLYFTPIFAGLNDFKTVQQIATDFRGVGDGFLKGGIFLNAGFFLPDLKDFRHDPIFADITERSGVMDYWRTYWRTTGKLPDFCATENAPVCATLKATAPK